MIYSIKKEGYYAITINNQSYNDYSRCEEKDLVSKTTLGGEVRVEAAKTLFRNGGIGKDNYKVYKVDHKDPTEPKNDKGQQYDNHDRKVARCMIFSKIALE